MTQQSTYDSANDLVDGLAGLQGGGSTHALRHQREKVAAATQGSYDTLFNPELPGLTLAERLLVALYACRLTPAPELAAHYRDRLRAQQVEADLIGAVEHGQPEDLADLRLREMLVYTRKLTERPVEGDQAALHALPAAGISTPAVVILSQLIAFISFQARLLAGLKAIKSQETPA